MAGESKVGKHAVVALGGGLDIWVTITVYTEGDIVIPITANGHSYICTVGGTSDVAEPTFPTTPGETVSDATVTWTENGIDANKILGMGVWERSGGSYAMLDDSEFCDDDMTEKRGIRTGGTVSFSGNYNSDDTAGQDAIILAYWNGTDLTDLRFYEGSDTGIVGYSYFAPNDSLLVGGGLPANIPISHIKITEEPTITADKNALTQISFTGKVEVAMRRFEFT